MNLKEMSDEELVDDIIDDSISKDFPQYKTELLSRLNRGRKAIEAMAKLEWSAVHDYSTGWSCCPICRGIKPGHGKDKEGRMPASGHKEACYFYAKEATDDRG